MKTKSSGILFVIFLIVFVILPKQYLLGLNPPTDIGYSILRQDPIKIQIWFDVDVNDLDVVEYRIFLAKGQSTNESEFVIIGTKPKSTESRYYLDIDNLAPGQYSFFVKAMNNVDVFSQRSKIIYVDVSIDDSTKILVDASIPEYVCKDSNLLIEFSSVLKNTNASQFVYTLKNAPEDMYITQTGALIWNVPDSYQFNTVTFTVEVSVDGKPSVTTEKNYNLTISDCIVSPIQEIRVKNPITRTCVNKEYVYTISPKYYGPSPNSIFSYTKISGPEGLNVSQSGTITFTPTEQRSYNIYILIEAISGLGDVLFVRELYYNLTSIVCDETKEKPKLRLVSLPKKEICLLNEKDQNSIYQYHLSSAFNNGYSFPTQYNLINAPKDMVILSNGTLVWRPKNAGYYNVELEATSNLIDGNTLQSKQQFSINVIDCSVDRPLEQICAVLKGNVTTQSLDPILEGSNVSIFRVDVQDEFGNEIKNIQRLYKAPITNGTYSASVPKGIYKMRIGEGTIVQEWFEDVNVSEDAKEITISCGETKEVDFQVNINNFTDTLLVQGRVTEIQSGLGIENAKVTIHPKNKNYKNGQPFPKFITSTSSNGNYTVKVFGSSKYGVSVEKEGYFKQYFNNVTNILSAEIVEKNNSSNVDFAMTKHENVTKGLYGSVKDESGAGVLSKVIAFQVYDSLGNENTQEDMNIFSVETNEIGDFDFISLPQGKYILLAIPFDSDIIPGYFVADQHTIYEEFAFVVDLFNYVTNTSLDFIVAQRNGANGLGSMSGIVKKGLNQGISFPTIDQEPIVSGAMVIVYDDYSTIVSTGISEKNGSFIVDELSIGTYNVLVQKLGYIPYYGSITIDADAQLSQNSDIELLPKTQTSVERKADSPISISPNPASNIVRISNNESSIPTAVEVFNVLGDKVMTVQPNQSIGTSQFVFSVSSLPSGKYHLKIVYQNNIQMIPLTIIK